MLSLIHIWAECDVNCQEVVSEMEKDKIRERNRENWKRFNDEASEFYKKKMRLLDEVEDFKADASFHGNKAPHHMMYKLCLLYTSFPFFGLSVEMCDGAGKHPRVKTL